MHCHLCIVKNYDLPRPVAPLDLPLDVIFSIPSVHCVSMVSRYLLSVLPLRVTKNNLISKFHTSLQIQHQWTYDRWLKNTKANNQACNLAQTKHTLTCDTTFSISLHLLHTNGQRIQNQGQIPQNQMRWRTKLPVPLFKYLSINHNNKFLENLTQTPSTNTVLLNYSYLTVSMLQQLPIYWDGQIGDPTKCKEPVPFEAQTEVPLNMPDFKSFYYSFYLLSCIQY